MCSCQNGYRVGWRWPILPLPDFFRVNIFAVCRKVRIFGLFLSIGCVMDKVRVAPAGEGIKVSSIEANVKYIVTDSDGQPIDTIQSDVHIPIEEKSVPWYEYVWRFMPSVYQLGRILIKWFLHRK